MQSKIILSIQLVIILTSPLLSSEVSNDPFNGIGPGGTSGLPDFSKFGINNQEAWVTLEENTYEKRADTPYGGEQLEEGYMEYFHSAYIKVDPSGRIYIGLKSGIPYTQDLYTATISETGYEVITNSAGVGDPTGLIRIDGTSKYVFDKRSKEEELKWEKWVKGPSIVQNPDKTFTIEGGEWLDWINLIIPYFPLDRIMESEAWPIFIKQIEEITEGLEYYDGYWIPAQDIE
jgi:hypothetical protein